MRSFIEYSGYARPDEITYISHTGVTSYMMYMAKVMLPGDIERWFSIETKDLAEVLFPMSNPNDFVRSYLLDPYPKCAASPECFEEGNPDLEGKCEACYRSEYMAIVQAEAIKLEAILKEKQRHLLFHQTKIAMKRGRIRHMCKICEDSGQARSFLNNVDATEHVLLCHIEAHDPNKKKPTTKKPGSKPKSDTTVVEEYI